MPKRIMIIDTETISLNRPYVYDIGFIVAEKIDNKYQIVLKTQFIVDQIYNNKPLFNTSYYSKKRPLYVSMLKGKRAKRKKFGWAINNLQKVVKQYNVEKIFAYNSPFDIRALEFTAKELKYKLDIFSNRWVDLHSVANVYIHSTQDYRDFATKNNFIGKSKKFFQTNSETTYKFIKNNLNVKVPHTSLQDCEIELEILNYAIKKGYQTNKKVSQTFIGV